MTFDNCYKTDREISISNIIQCRKIENLIHFTRICNIPSIFEFGLLPRSDIVERKISTVVTDSIRLDRHLDAVSLSVGYPNSKMFYKYRRGDDENYYNWGVIELDPLLLLKYPCSFFPKNAASSDFNGIDWQKFSSPENFEKMFEGDRGDKPALPKDVQAEILVFSAISANYIKNVHIHPCVAVDDKLMSDCFHKIIKNDFYFNDRAHSCGV